VQKISNLQCLSSTQSKPLSGTSIRPNEIISKSNESLTTVPGDCQSKRSDIDANGGLGGHPLQGLRGMENFFESPSVVGEGVYLVCSKHLDFRQRFYRQKVKWLGQARLSECL
jgi:hypothetical protein